MFVTYKDGDGFTAWGVKIWGPGEGARNTDGIDPGNSTNITIAHCFLHTGDDNVCLKPNAGRPTTHVSVFHNHFYTGHGMSIGSETSGGGSSVRVSDLSMDGTKHGIRIKSNNTRGGVVTDVVYEDVCLRNVIDPIVMDAAYTNFQSQAKGLIPDFNSITLRNIRVMGGGNLILNGSDAQHRLGIAFDNVVLDGPAKFIVTSSHANVTLGPGAVNFHPEGEDVTVQGSPVQATPNSCNDKFVPFPEN
jgi:polygalacturonase